MKIATILILLVVACSSKNSDLAENQSQNTTKNHHQNSDSKQKKTNSNKNSTIKKYKMEIVETLPHNTDFYTQGLLILGDKMYEGTGLEGNSRLVRLDLKTQKIEQETKLQSDYFGEGITIFGDKMYQLTWLNQICLVYDLKTLQKVGEFTYSGEGWGLTSNDSLIFMSDGSATVKVIEPKNFTTVKNIKFHKNNVVTNYLNELELVDNLLYANIYAQDLIIIADINSGEIVGELDISGLRQHLSNPNAEVSNGIAFNKKTGYFYLTGKNWDKIFVVKIEQQ